MKSARNVPVVVARDAQDALCEQEFEFLVYS